MTCKDCRHYECCEVLGITSGQYEREACVLFATRSELVHMPCKAGDTVYYFDGAYYLKNKNNWKITPIKVTELSTKIGKSGKLYPLSIIANGTRYSITSIGKTVFLIREEAEKALDGNK